MSDFDDDFAPQADASSVIKYKQWEIGGKVQGRIVNVPKKLPDTDFQTKEQKVSKAGNLKWKYGITLEVDGDLWKIYPEGKVYWEVLNAFKGAGVKNYEDTVDGIFAMKRVDDTPSSTAGFAPSKNYVVKFVKA